MSQLPSKPTPLASSATKAAPNSNSRLQTGNPSLGQQQQQAQKQQQPKQQQQTQQKRINQEVPLADRTRAASPAKSNSTAPPKESQRTSRSDPSKGSHGGTDEDPSDPLVVNYQGLDRFFSFAENEKMWDYVMKNVKAAGSKKPGVKQPEVKR